MIFLYVCQPDASHFAQPYLKYVNHWSCVTRDTRAASQVKVEYNAAWVEWGNAFAARLFTHGALPGFTVLRIHDWEVRLGIVKNIDFRCVDAVWFINPDTSADFNKIIDYPDERQFFLPNAIDLAAWPLCATGDKHIGIITLNVQQRKRLDRAVQLMGWLPDAWRMTIRTSPTPHPQYRNMVANLESRVEEANASRKIPGRITLEWREIDTRQIVPMRQDVIDFWSDKSHAVSTAEHEGFCYGVAEGMACGAAGAVYNWEWGKPRTFYSCVRDDLAGLADLIQATEPGEQWRAQMEPFAAPALAYKLEETITKLMQDVGMQPRR